MKPSLYFRALLGECIPIPDMTAAEILAIEEGIRGILEAAEKMSLPLPDAIKTLEGGYERKWNELIETTGDRIAQADREKAEGLYGKCTCGNTVFLMRGGK